MFNQLGFSSFGDAGAFSLCFASQGVQSRKSPLIAVTSTVGMLDLVQDAPSTVLLTDARDSTFTVTVNPLDHNRNRFVLVFPLHLI